MPTANPQMYDLPREVWRRLERILERFEDAWERGERPALEDYLAGEGRERQALLIELVHEDLEYRLKAGEAARVEMYLGHHPELAGDGAVVLALLRWEMRCRRVREPALGLDEYARRFPQHHAELTGSLPDTDDARRSEQPVGDGQRRAETRSPGPTPGGEP